jgi:hypothetical protein
MLLLLHTCVLVQSLLVFITVAVFIAAVGPTVAGFMYIAICRSRWQAPKNLAALLHLMLLLFHCHQLYYRWRRRRCCCCCCRSVLAFQALLVDAFEFSHDKTGYGDPDDVLASLRSRLEESLHDLLPIESKRISEGGKGESSSSSSVPRSNRGGSRGPGTSAAQQQEQEQEKKEKKEKKKVQEHEGGSQQREQEQLQQQEKKKSKAQEQEGGDEQREEDQQEQQLSRRLQEQVLLARARSVGGWGCHNRQCTSLEGASEGKVKGRRCMGCLTARYCSVSCQKAAYREHKLVCKHLGQQQHVPAGPAVAAATRAPTQVAAKRTLKEQL